MGLLLKKGLTSSQKIVGSLLIAIFIGPTFILFTHNFVSEPWVSEFSCYLSLVLTVFSIVVMLYLYVKNLWRPAAAWYNFSKLKKVFVVTAMPFLVFGGLWINFAIFLPQVFTLAFGSVEVRSDVVKKIGTILRGRVIIVWNLSR